MHLRLKGYSHQSATEQEHKHKIGSSSSERALFQHSTVSVGEDHVEQEIKTNGAKKHEICQQPPYLKQ